jgi:hypothetical protein
MPSRIITHKMEYDELFLNRTLLDVHIQALAQL